MKITNTSTSVLTFGYGDDAQSIPPGETSGELKLDRDDPYVAAHLTAQNIKLSDGDAPKADEAATH